MQDSRQDYCAEQTRTMDYPHYVMTLFAPAEKRPALWALYAFNIELAKIRSLVTEPMMGLIRLQWWRDAIAKMYAGEVLRHEVLTALNKTIKWNEQDFIALIDAYEGDLEINHFATEDALWQHAETIGPSLLRMVCAVYGPPVDEAALTILGSCEYIINRLEHDRRCISLNKKSIMNDILQKINSVDRRNLKQSPAFLSYDLVQWRLKAMIKAKPPNDWLLGFYFWRKSFGF
jgi:hypothetical protein